MNEKSTAQVKKTWVILGVSSLGILSGLQTYSVSAEEQVATNPVPINQTQIESPQTGETSIAKVNQIASNGTIESPQNPVTVSGEHQSVSTPVVSSTTNNPSNSEVSPSEKTVKSLASTEATVTKPTVNYTSHVSNVGWQNFSTSSQLAGSLTNNNRLEAIQFKLSGLLDSQYDLKYRAYVQNQGWQNWVYDNYIAGTTGQSKAIEALEIQLVEKSKASQGFIQNERPQQGLADVVILAGASGKPISKIKVAAWSTADQSNLAWYESAAASSGATTIRINQQRHKSLIGKYTVHAYVYYQDGSVQKIEVGTTNLRAALITPYYNQRDSRWASKRYGQFYLGPTGCVPTSLAMIFSSISGKTILPPQVADYLYTKTNEFDKDGPGTTNNGILAAVANFGYKATNLGSQSAISAALQAGYHVACAIQYNQFVIHGSHEMVLKGYSNGSTYVYDPYTKELCGWYSIANLWREQSTQEGDRIGIPAPFYKIISL